MERVIGTRSMLRVIAVATMLTVGAPASMSSASASTTVTMPVGGVVNVPAPGITQADVAPAGVAGAWAAADHVTVWGLQQGTATLVMTSSEGIEARPVQVSPVNPAQARFGVGACPAPLAISVTSAAHAAPNTNVVWSPGEWQAFWNFPGSSEGRFTATNRLNTPLAMLGIPDRPGVDVAWDRWDVAANQSVAALAYQMPLGSGMMMELDTTLGPIGEATVAAGDVSVSSLVLLSQTGQLVAATQTNLAVGPFGWTALVEIALGPGRVPDNTNSAATLTGVILPDGACGFRTSPVSAAGQ